MKDGIKFRVCCVVPHFNHMVSLRDFLPRLVSLDLPIIVVDDGSEEEQKAALQDLLAQHPNIHLCNHVINRGKGAAMLTGAERAIELGFSHMLQIDADGQHDTDDVAKFIRAGKKNPLAIVSGAPQFDESAPKARVYGRKVTDFWVAIETWSLQVQDSLCGFRLYPLAAFQEAYRRFHIGPRMDFDTDIMVKSVWMGVELEFIETDVVYVPGNVSHFHYLRDNLRLIWLHFRLMLGMLVRAPGWILVGAWQFLTGHKQSKDKRSLPKKEAP